jgi:hypothetical protein
MHVRLVLGFPSGSRSVDPAESACVSAGPGAALACAPTAVVVGVRRRPGPAALVRTVDRHPSDTGAPSGWHRLVDEVDALRRFTGRTLGEVPKLVDLDSDGLALLSGQVADLQIKDHLPSAARRISSRVARRSRGSIELSCHDSRTGRSGLVRVAVAHRLPKGTGRWDG